MHIVLTLALFLIMLPQPLSARLDQDKFYIERIFVFATYDAAYVLDLANGLLRPDKQVTEADVNCVLNELRSTGLFENIRVEWTEQAQGIKTLTLHCKPKAGRDAFLLSGIVPVGMPEIPRAEFIEQMEAKHVKAGNSLVLHTYQELNEKLDEWFRASASSDVAKKYRESAWITYRPTGARSFDIRVMASRPGCNRTGLAPGRRIPSLRTVRSDFGEASVVVRMNITDTKPTSSDDYHYYFTASGKVTTSFKGKFKPGQHLEFNVRAEHGYSHTDMLGDQLAFLTSFVDRRNGPFQVLPSGDSVEPYSTELLANVRRVWRETHRSSKGRK